MLLRFVQIFLLGYLALCSSIAYATKFDEAVQLYEAENYAVAATLFKSLAYDGHVDAQNNLGVLYQTGNGVERDYQKAAQWFNKAARAGNADAAFNLSTFYRLGIGVPRDLVKAYAWSLIAAQYGNTHMMAVRDRLESRLTIPERNRGRAEARDLARAFMMTSMEMTQDQVERILLTAIPDLLADGSKKPLDRPKPVVQTPAAPNINIPPGMTVLSPKGNSSQVSQLQNDATIIAPRGSAASPPTLNGKALPEGTRLITPKSRAGDLSASTRVIKPQGKIIPVDPDVLEEKRKEKERLRESTAKRRRLTPAPAQPVQPRVAPLVAGRPDQEPIYQPGERPIAPAGTTVISPRRRIPIREYPINRKVLLDDSLLRQLAPVAKAYQVSLDDLLIAVRKVNSPDLFEGDGETTPLKLKAGEIITIPAKKEVKRAG